jgi:hypothetical protein
MRVNIFEGARRIALALGILWVGGCVAYAVFAEPYAHLHFSINGLGAAPVRVERCGDNDGARYIATKDGKGNSVGVTLCFKAVKSDSGEPLVPYAPAENGRWLVAAPYSPEVMRYMKEREEEFRLPPQGMEEAGRLRWESLLEQWKYAVITALSGLAVGWFLTAVMGWIARGFLGIPRGKDSRPLQPEQTED